MKGNDFVEKEELRKIFTDVQLNLLEHFKVKVLDDIVEKEELRNCVIEYSTKTMFGGKNYNKFVEKFVFICRKLNKIICCTGLGEYGLPTKEWFLTHCPDKSVKGYHDFCKLCGLEDILNKTKKEYLFCLLTK